MATITLQKLLLIIGLVAGDVSALTFSHMTNRDVITLYTANEAEQTDWSQFSLTVTDRDFFSFQVRACAEARVLIESVVGISPDEEAGDNFVLVTEVALGADNNSALTVSTPPSGHDLAKVNAPNVLDCNDFRQFWVSWRNDTLKIGRGPIYNQQLLLSLDSAPERFTGVSQLFLATAGSNTGMWRIDENSGYTSLVRTPPSGVFSRLWRSVEFRAGWFPFSLQSSGHASVGLGATSGFADYQIVLGHSANDSVLLKNGQVVAKSKRNTRLSLLHFLPFWVSWDAGLIQLGEGHEKSVNILLHYKDPDFQNVGHLGFTSSHGVWGKWAVRETSDNAIVTSLPLVPGQTEAPLFVSAPTAPHVTFSIHACSDARVDFTRMETGAELFVSAPMAPHVAFSVHACSDTRVDFTCMEGWEDDSTIRVVLGANNNMQIVVSTSFSPNVKVIAMPDLLDCDGPVLFWAAWRLGPLTLGRGLWEEQNVILRFSDPVVPDLHSVSFSNARSDVPVKVTVDDTVGDEVLADLPPTLTSGRLLLSTRGAAWRAFRVAGGGGLQLVLSDALGPGGPELYRLVFGTDGRSIWVDRTLPSGITRSNATRLPLPLSDDERRPFWVSWTHNVVKVGEGHRVGHRTLVSLSAGSPYTVRALTPATSPSTFTSLALNMDQDELLSVRIPAGTSDDSVRWFRLSATRNWAYFQLANNGTARLSLSTWYRSETNEEYVLSFCEGGANKVILRRNNEKVAESAILEKWNKQDLRDFWVSWENDEISAGSSRYKGFQQFFAGFKLSGRLQAFGFYPEKNSITEWVIPHVFGPEATVVTVSGEVGETWLQAARRSGLVFGVQACRNAKVHLATSMYSADQAAYMVEIGGSNNVDTRIWADGSLKMSTQTKNILSCTQERYFWVTWYQGAITVGKGQHVGQGTIPPLLARPRPSVINAVTMTTTDADGRWRIGFLGASLAPPPPAPTTPPGRALGAGAITGIVIGCLVFVLLGVSGVWFFRRGATFRGLWFTAPSGGIDVHAQPEQFNNPIKQEVDMYGDE